MIIDTLSNSCLYHGVHKYFGKAFEFIKNQAPTLSVGRYEVQGDEVYAMISDSTLKEFSDASLEVHDKYIDIQAVLSDSSETFGFACRCDCHEPRSEMNGENDIQFFDDPLSDTVTLHQGMFVVFFPHDAHAPLIGKAGDKVRKVVVKVKF